MKTTLKHMTMLVTFTIMAAVAFAKDAGNENKPDPNNAAKSGELVVRPPWENVSEPLFEMAYPNYGKQKEAFLTNPFRFGAKVASIAVDRLSGEAYASISNGNFYRSRDKGQTWEKIEAAKLIGRAWEGRQVQVDSNRSGRVAVFRIAEKYFRDRNGFQTSGMTLDGGTTWISFTDPRTDGSKDKDGNLKNHDGWTYGQVDWSEDPPKTIMAKQHHSSNVWASKDGGATWINVHQKTRTFGLAGKGKLLAADIAQGGIFVSADWGATWKKTSDAKVHAEMSVLFNDKVYWCAQQGVLVSADQGETWNLLGSPLNEVFYGPYFGKDEHELLVITKEGFFLSRDSAASWKKIAPFLIIEDGYDNAISKITAGSQFYTFGWDWKNGFIYAACVGGSIYRLKLASP